MQAKWKKYTLNFHNPAGTSRGFMKTRDVWYIHLSKDGITGIGECAPLPGLSIDDPNLFEEVLSSACLCLENEKLISDEILFSFPSIRFGIEMAIRDLEMGGNRILFDTAFTRSKSTLSINGLIWMGSFEYMKNQIHEKVKSRFNVIKIKIGAIEFEKEIKLLDYIRHNVSEDIELRLDANGAFSPDDVMDKTNSLMPYNIHSIEQPIQAGQLMNMAILCKESPIPIALDEELIPWQKREDKKRLLADIKPQYIILKPSLVGGFVGAQEWIDIANDMGIGWWITSALESNIGLNAIAQWTATFKSKIPHGLGTGRLFTNNIESPLEAHNGILRYSTKKNWGSLD